MKIKVPFVRNLKKWKGRGWCGPFALASILRYYKDKTPVDEVAKGAGAAKSDGKGPLSGGTSPEGLIFFCLSRGFKVDYVNRYKTFSYEQKEYSTRYKRFLKQFGSKKYEEKYKPKCEQFSGYKFIRKNPTLHDIEKYLKGKKPVLLYLNIAIPYGEEKLWPHYVAIVGYDKDNFYMHNIYPKNSPYQKISKKLFAKSWKSDGMNELLIVPYK